MIQPSANLANDNFGKDCFMGDGVGIIDDR